MQPRIFCFYHVLGGLKAYGDGLVSKYDVCSSQLSVEMNKDLELEYPRQVGLINEVEIGTIKCLSAKIPKTKVSLE